MHAPPRGREGREFYKVLRALRKRRFSIRSNWMSGANNRIFRLPYRWKNRRKTMIAGPIGHRPSPRRQAAFGYCKTDLIPLESVPTCAFLLAIESSVFSNRSLVRSFGISICFVSLSLSIRCQLIDLFEYFVVHFVLSIHGNVI